LKDEQARSIMVNTPPGRLYVVATPIGNLGDFSPRARETLAACGLIAAEDTRHTGLLLKHFGIETPQLSLHDHNESSRIPDILARLRQGVSVALVSDAGTPAISDPGFELVRAAAAEGFEVRSVPGACAAIAALSIGALPTDRFCFEGFLAARGAARRRHLESLQNETRTVVLYESPHRIAETLADCAEVFGAARAATVVRETTKLHESVYRGSLAELIAAAQADEHMGRGEIVLLIAGAPPPDTAQSDALLDRALLALLKEMPLKQAARLAAQITGARDNEAYKRALTLKEG
jgi:16S rRNA (cytidine1402-2'-O)-methyltransferase